LSLPCGLVSSVSLDIEPFLFMSMSTTEFVSVSESTSGHIHLSTYLVYIAYCLNMSTF